MQSIFFPRCLSFLLGSQPFLYLLFQRGRSESERAHASPLFFLASLSRVKQQQQQQQRREIPEEIDKATLFFVSRGKKIEKWLPTGCEATSS